METEQLVKGMEQNVRNLGSKKDRLLELYNLSKELELEEQQKKIADDLSDLCERLDDMYSEMEYIKRREEQKVKSE